MHLANRFASVLEVHIKRLRSHAGQSLWDLSAMQMGLFGGNGQADALGRIDDMSLNSLFDWFESSLAPLDLEDLLGGFNAAMEA